MIDLSPEDLIVILTACEKHFVTISRPSYNYSTVSQELQVKQLKKIIEYLERKITNDKSQN